MRSRLAIALAALAMLAALGPASASAATEFGDACAADEEAPGPYTLVTLSSPGSGLPLTAPISGVITKVKLNRTVPIPIPVPQLIKVLRPAGGDSYTVVNQTTIQSVQGLTVADARMPVQVGDKLGNFGPDFSFEGTPVEGFTFYCDNVPGVLGATPGDVGVGQTTGFSPATEGRTPLAAVIEPDVDNDGFGDETQDGCPQSAALQTPCPSVTIDAVGVPSAKSVLVMVAASSAAPVSVSGVVNLGKGKKATLNAGPQTVSPGTLTRFKLKFSAKLTKRLEELAPSKKLTLKITASATNVAGQVSTDQTKSKLKGQA